MTPDLAHTESITVDATPEEVYALLTDISRTGEWSPVCVRCEWDEGAGPQVGAWFTGYNQLEERAWETRSQVVAAEPGREFAWQVGGTWVRWGYALAPVDGGTEVTESWEFLDEGLEMFHDSYGPRADAQIASRAEQAHSGIPLTLAAIKQIFASPR